MNDKKSVYPNELSCEECRDVLSEYADKEMRREDLEAVERHLANCEKCSSESTRLHGIKRVVQHWDGIKGSGEWRKSVMEEFIRESRMMPAAPFKEAAESVREAPEAPKRLSAPLVLGIAVALAIVAYVVTKWLLTG